MSPILVKIISPILLSPLPFLILAVIGYRLSRGKHKRWGQALFALCIIVPAILTMPAVADRLLQTLEIYPALQASDVDGAQAIVVLGAGVYDNQPEYQSSSLTPSALERIRYAAYLYRKTHLPILVSGGNPLGGDTDAEVMQRELTTFFNTPVKWVESKSANTAQNAQMSWELLHKEGISKILLVTHATHMRRAKASFDRVGFTVIPAPTVFREMPPDSILNFVPQLRTLGTLNTVLHEWVGILWYRVQRIISPAPVLGG
jgi:uncharacterized SAM-binding protein YcdF (DUF218 family)